jgi:hypothetical protein
MPSTTKQLGGSYLSSIIADFNKQITLQLNNSAVKNLAALT